MKIPNPQGWLFGATPLLNGRWAGVMLRSDKKTVIDTTALDYPTKELAGAAAYGLMHVLAGMIYEERIA